MIIGLDVGGTHTDVVLLGKNGLIREFKIPTNQSDLFETVLTGLHQVTDGIDPNTIGRVVFSTTLTTNAIVQKETPPVGIIVTAGPGIDAALLQVSDHYHSVTGAIDHRGREIQPVNTDEIIAISRKLVTAGVHYVGVVGKFSTRNPSHELKIASLLEGQFEKVFLGHQMSGNLNFPRRIATVYLNAAVYPIHKTFFEAVQKSLVEKGILRSIKILKPDGGTMRFDSSIDYPGHTILSGPAASVMGALPYASKNVGSLVLDIGGTTTDMAVLVDGVPLLDPLGAELGGYKTLIHAMNTHSIGVGGDSFVRVIDGRLEIGPDRKGPAMAFGGLSPTPTDALFVLGLISDGNRQKSIDGLTPVAEALGTTVENAAALIHEKTCQDILDAATQMIVRINSKPVYTVHELLENYKVNPTEILVLGGPAAILSKKLEEISALTVRALPNSKVANAIGAALARTTCELTFFADTEQGICTAPEENYLKKIGKEFSNQDAVREAFELLRHKGLQMGADPDHLEMEVVENIQFNMVRGFYTTGRNIRTKVQIKPGLIHGYELFAGLETPASPS
ncbi:MAG: hydantoinase/oxoprolinase family protein [Desulfobacterales bacterium]|jgi:N-methylhydantoinase A/oxoprolinase/acetone carboxylase beta subunit|nr:hydantoinase/oxoprolinase family protein [Desulfobacterales bacterium]